MPDPNKPDEQISKKVVYEHVTSSGTSRNAMIVIAVILVIALVIVGYILTHLHH